jgi:hypothetical protein
MKNFSIILFLFLFLPFVSAVQLSINQNFSQGETIIAKISGNFISPITNDNIFFCSGYICNENFRIPMEYEVLKLGDDYYLYAITTGKSAGNYSLSIQNVQYMRGSQVANDTIAANFSITNSTADFSVNPGFVYSSGDFYLQVQNLQNNDLTITVNTATNDSSARQILISPSSTYSPISLSSGEIKKINFAVGAGSPSLRMVELKSNNFTYEIPVYLFSSSSSTNGNVTESFEIDPQSLTISVPTNATTTKTIYLYNLGDTELDNVSLSLPDSLNSSMNLSQYYIQNLSSKSGIPIDLSFFSTIQKTVTGSLVATSGEKTISSSIFLTFVNNYTVSNQSILTQTCAELNGTVCNSTQQCDREPIYATDNVCCLGTCNDIPANNSGTIIGIVIVVVILAAVIFFYIRYKKAKKPVNLLEISKGKNPSPKL